MASVQAGDKSTALHTQTQGFCGWVTPGSPGALTVAVLFPLAGSGLEPVTSPAQSRSRGLIHPQWLQGFLRGFVTDGPFKQATLAKTKTRKPRRLRSHAGFQKAPLIFYVFHYVLLLCQADGGFLFSFFLKITSPGCSVKLLLSSWRSPNSNKSIPAWFAVQTIKIEWNHLNSSDRNTV